MGSHRLLLGTLRSAGWYGTGLALVALVEVSTALALPMAVATAVDTLTGSAMVVVAVLLAAATVAEMAGVVLEKRAEAHGALRLRRSLLSRVLGFDLGTARRFTTGDLVSRTLQSTTAAATVTMTAVSLYASLLTSVGGVIALVLIDVWLGVVLLALVPAVFLFSGWLTRQLSANTERYQGVFADLLARLEDSLRGARTIRASGTVERETDRVLAVLPRLSAEGREFWRVQEKAIWRANLVMPLLQVAVLAVAGHAALLGRITPGEFLAVQGYFGFATEVFRQNVMLARLARAQGSAERVAEVLGQPLPPSGPAPLAPGPGSLSLRGIRVDRDGHRVLDGVDLDIPAGSTVALVGPSGSGKSTLAEVAGGLLHPDSGAVSVDGQRLDELRREDVRGAIAYAFERPHLLGETVADAVGYADQPPPRDRLVAALRTSRAEDFVNRLPKGSRTPLARLRLSGGELQRLGLARAVWREARIVVFDDATSSVDTATEADITAALGRALTTRTRLVLAHRLGTAAQADIVAWLDRGRLRGFAPHHELLREPDYRAVFGAHTAELAGTA
ncbi:ABC transporter ATP-binding protein/permease [Allokutzneria sp. A3M-2-11 16]|uniref:ABC transporter ATP-binding protein n=1 Tax=Allokutzneria sp. A3M-2-11 16 TaxID=2962043 RepID=UPI0020B65006|nr:ATP-binding cassette domain-containing protein [Allokutzneria sp. A3M-2-11 16]MCP3803393.1 ABC transporter ATP-binding protein/permease [Allokutzneria sp. A3M-2-11 16]